MTKVVGSTGPQDIPALEARHASQQRSPPKAVQLLLPVWGQRFIRQFLEYGLPTLLAPGNLPAIASRLPSKFVFLTSREDANQLRDHVAFRYLSSICETQINLIDDLITGDNYSTTITLAYARGMRATGEAMRDTCFFFLISDYLVADGSLASVLECMEAGTSGVLAGNFQVVAEDAARTFYKRFDRGTPELVLPPRDLMAWALTYLHPMTAANMVNFPLCHSVHSNRLFWRVDENTLIGRFFLMHMICIRPEVADFLIGSSCDYSFIPEMCPSGNVSVLTDSDNYLVVEMQPRRHERDFLHMGPIDPKVLAADLSEWTTRRHRENADVTLIFHAADIPSVITQATKQATAFIAMLNRAMSRKPKPHRNHPYWVSAIAAHRWAISKRNESVDDFVDIGLDSAGSWRGRLTTLIHNFRFWVFGRAPRVRPWHPRWPDYRVLENTLRPRLAERDCHVLVLSNNPWQFEGWLADSAKRITNWHLRRLLDVDRPQYASLVTRVDGCVLFLDMEELELARVLTERIRPLLKNDAFLLIEAANSRGTGIDDFFNVAVVQHADRFLNFSTWISSIEFVVASRLRLTVYKSLLRLNKATVRRPLAYLPLTVLSVFFLAIGSLFCNLVALRTTKGRARHKLYSSICMTLRPSGGDRPMPEFVVEEPRYWRPGRIKTALEPRVELAPEPEGA